MKLYFFIEYIPTQFKLEVVVKKSILRYFAIVPLLVATLMSSFTWTGVSAEDVGTVADFSKPDSDQNVSVEGSELLELLLGAQVGSAEAEYVDKSGLYKFIIYGSTIPQSSIKARVNADGLFVTVSNWEYVAKNGETVTWTPYSVTFNGIVKDVDGEGEYLFEGDWLDVTQFDISAEYETEISIDPSLYNSLVNYAYNGASVKAAELADYDERLAAYELATEVYGQYLKDVEDYNDKHADYEAYLDDYAEYEKKQKDYDYYLVKLEEYTVKKNAYESYLADLDKYKADKKLFDDYRAELSRYNQQNIQYGDYLNKINARLDKLSALAAIYTENSEGRTLYYTIMGDTVDEVVDRKDEIVMAGASEAAVYAAGESTTVLRELLEDYRECKGDKARYEFYLEHYDTLCKNFYTLNSALRAFYDAEAVLAVLKSYGKLERYRQFLAQLYVATTCLDDTRKRDENWCLSVEGGKKAGLSDLLESVHIVQDTDKARPTEEWPTEVAEPVEPEKVEEPVKPTEVKNPGNPPNEPKLPTPPTVVEEPVEPDKVEAPGEPPNEVSMTAEEKAIVDALRSGEITKRSEVSEGVAVRRTAGVSLSTADLDKHHVSFVSGGTVIFEYDVADGGELILPTEIPTRESTAEFDFTFSSWKDESGQDVTVSKVYSNLEFHASFTSTTRSYPITWVVDGTEYTYEVEYGVVPTFGGVTDKPMDERKIYTFNGWDNDPSRVTGPFKYTAKYHEEDRTYSVIWNVDENAVVEKYKYGETPSFKGKTEKATDDTYVYTFEGWSPSPTPITEDTSYEATYSKKALVLDGEGKPVTVKTENTTYNVKVSSKSADITLLYEQALKKEYGIKMELDGCTLTLSSLAISRLSDKKITKVAASVDEKEVKLLLCDAGGNVIMGGEKAVIEYPNFDDTEAHLFGSVDGVEEPIYVEDGRIVQNIASGQTITTLKKYTVTVLPSELGSYSASKEMAEAGEKIQLTAGFIKQEYFVKDIIITANASGERVAFDAATGTFVMPVGGATVEAVYERQSFTVIFVVEGNVISERVYYLGDTVELPPDPTKEGTEKYTYTFRGWSPEVVAVSADAVYTAVFSESRLADEVEMSEEGFESNKYTWPIILGTVGAVGVAGVGGGAAIIAAVVKAILRRKKR